MKEALKSILKLLRSNGDFLMQVSADVSALKIVVSSLGPEVQNALAKHIETERHTLAQQTAEYRKLLESLKATVYQIPN